MVLMNCYIDLSGDADFKRTEETYNLVTKIQQKQ